MNRWRIGKPDVGSRSRSGVAWKVQPVCGVGMPVNVGQQQPAPFFDIGLAPPVEGLPQQQRRTALDVTGVLHRVGPPWALPNQIPCLPEFSCGWLQRRLQEHQVVVRAGPRPAHRAGGWDRELRLQISSRCINSIPVSYRYSLTKHKMGLSRESGRDPHPDAGASSLAVDSGYKPLARSIVKRLASKIGGTLPRRRSKIPQNDCSLVAAIASRRHRKEARVPRRSREAGSTRRGWSGLTHRPKQRSSGRWLTEWTQHRQGEWSGGWLGILGCSTPPPT